MFRKELIDEIKTVADDADMDCSKIFIADDDIISFETNFMIFTVGVVLQASRKGSNLENIIKEHNIWLVQ